MEYGNKFLWEIYQLRDKLCDLEEVVSAERLASTIIDALPAEKYFTIKTQAIIPTATDERFYVELEKD